MKTYSQLEDIWNTRRKSNDYKPLDKHGLRNCVLHYSESGKHFYIEFHRNRIVSIYPDNVMTLHSSGWYDSPTTRERIWCIAQVSITSDRKTVGLDATTRVNGLPFSADMKFRNGTCLNPEVCVDRITRLQKWAVARASKDLKTLRTLSLTMARCGMFEKTNRNLHHLRPHELSLTEPTGDDAQKVYEHGRASISWNRTDTDFVEAGLKRLREWLYKDYPNAYVTEEIRYGNDQRIAA
jgi:hypothetical protein